MTPHVLLGSAVNTTAAVAQVTAGSASLLLLPMHWEIQQLLAVLLRQLLSSSSGHAGLSLIGSPPGGKEHKQQLPLHLTLLPHDSMELNGYLTMLLQCM